MRLIMIIPATLAIWVWGTFVDAQQPQAQPDSPFFELIINGENFVVRKNRPTVLESKETPGVVYDVAVFTPRSRQMDMNTVRFNYDWPCTVHDNHDKQLRRVRLVHEAGFTMMITDLGGPMPPDKQVAATTDLVKGVMAMCKDKKNVRVEDRHKLDLANGVLRGVVVRYSENTESKAGPPGKPVPGKAAPSKTPPAKNAADKKEQEDELAHQSLLVQTLCGKEFAVTCVTHFVDRDFEDIKSLIKQTVDSFRRIPPTRAPSPKRPGR